MNLRDPKKKRRPKFKEQLPFPIILGDKNEWTTYTAHLTDVGSYVIDANEIAAIHSMGFFGKGSLSRGFPAFGKARYGTPPIIRNRQWIRRQEWLKQFNTLSMEANKKPINLENKYNDSYSENLDEDDVTCLNYPKHESTPDVIEIDVNFFPSNASHKKDEETPKLVEPKCLNSNPQDEDNSVVIIDKHIKEQCDSIDNNPKALIKMNEKGPCGTIVSEFKKDDIYFLDSNTAVENKLLVLPDSDSETENYLKEVKPKIECESYPIQETLHLTFEETFFLLHSLGCLNLVDFDGNLLDIDSAWHFFCKSDTNFIPKYVVYHYFRSKGWVVKPGLKYGGDFLLYKQGPPFYHASYIVIIDIIDGDSLARDESQCMRKFTWNNLFGLERLSETAAKEILFAQVFWPSSAPKTSNSLNLEMLTDFSVRELLWRRWNLKHTKDIEEDEDDSF